MAIKYSPAGSQVEIRAMQKDRKVLIAVKDSGAGIEKKDLPHIFDRFYRADTARTKQSKGGYGLGLSIAKKIAHNHKGSLKVTSQVGVGTIITVSLPVH
jgi:signal transduction histidine kinase